MVALSRRHFVSSSLGGAAGLWLPAGARAGACPRTASLTAGPFYRPGAPDSTDLRPSGLAGRELVLDLTVRGRDCKPVFPVLIDLWHADPRGNYDLEGFRFRTRRASERPGVRLVTFVPGRYPGRTPHLHLTVSAPGHRPLTTQLYLPGEALNERDFLFRPSLLLNLTSPAQSAGPLSGSYTFYLQPA
ncbi:hypothetical protein [Gloeobacter morelensis]|uniref:Intradiol ring-cleavage dioxygenase n=1 Tax=Gloeobacter morelensis MG652769 TaxID=2781736 RepID=A0ABY3PML9_9CYAN|nr:hypothetical protein [Gloeobacter morelensis]UFP94952.1 intradiol ring-cleavage dioxygenase [Gloeobacter morelensis MG652769]